MVWRSSVSVLVALSMCLILPTQAFQVNLVNSCPESIDIFDSKTTETVQAGGTIIRTVSPGGAYVYRKGLSGQATLAEFSADSNAAWYDISIIPTGAKQGPGNCGSLAECMAVTGGIGFNGAMSITPSQPDGNRCVPLTCMENGCSDAYQFPSDDTKTHNCPSTVEFTVTFCPGGATGSSAGSTTASPTTAPPVSTTAPPATVSPTQTPTTPSSTPPTTTTAPPTTSQNVPPTASSTGLQTTTPSPKVVDTAQTGDSSWDGIIGKVGVHNETSNSVEDDKSPYQTSTTKPVLSDTKTTAPSTVQSNNDSSVVQANTQSSNSNSGGTMYVVVGIGAAVGIVGVAIAVILRKKKRALDALENKSPVVTMRNNSTRHTVLMTNTNESTVIL